MGVFHTRVRARDDVAASVQRLQPKRVVPVKLSAGQEKEVRDGSNRVN